MSKCKEINELLPLLAAGTLDGKQREEVIEHLRSCPTCSDLFRNEMALYLVASASGEDAPLAEMPDSALIDRYARDPESLSGAENQEMLEFVKSHRWAEQLLANLRALPGDLDQLLQGRELPLLNSLEAEISKQSSRTDFVDLVKRVVWRPAVAYAIAAAILLAYFIIPQPDPRPALVPAFIPAASRLVEERPLFETPTPEAYLELTYCVGPEPGHIYDIGVRREGDAAFLFLQSDFRRFDQKGCFKQSVLLAVDDYELVVFDIDRADTLTVTRPFTLQLSE